MGHQVPLIDHHRFRSHQIKNYGVKFLEDLAKNEKPNYLITIKSTIYLD
jgi:hypothetical protein